MFLNSAASNCERMEMNRQCKSPDFCLKHSHLPKDSIYLTGPQNKHSSQRSFFFFDSIPVALAQTRHFLLFFCNNTLSGKQQWVIDNSLSRMICGGANTAYCSNEHEHRTYQKNHKIFLVFWRENESVICKAFLFFFIHRYSVEWKQILEKHSLLPISPVCRTNQSSLVAQGLSISDERCSAPPTKATSKQKTCTQNSSGFVIYFKSSILKTCLQKDQLQNFLGRHHYLSDMNNWTGVIT